MLAIVQHLLCIFKTIFESSFLFFFVKFFILFPYPLFTYTNNLGHVVLGTITTLGHSPVNVLGGHLDVTGLAVDTVLRVDLESDALGLGFVSNVLVDTGGAEAVLNTLVNGVRLGRMGIKIVAVLDAQMAGLIVVVVGARAANTRENVKGQFAIRLGVVNGLVLISRHGGSCVSCLVMECPGSLALEQEGVKTRV